MQVQQCTSMENEIKAVIVRNINGNRASVPFMLPINPLEELSLIKQTTTLKKS